ncbi:HD domain-containing protein [Leuconostoc kimchii]|uniref:Exopolyphosphatase n=2 Tax=Leuconostoc kimchii TaxID=136609 RepID=D5T3Q5_LEUKI|nr:HD domain-containing protein [Leuconostoc kimchii]ADG40904.1 exopolyphosphatase [Leuconostoc kimchii IMSNU 11154]QBR48211.1 HD domain-containing protein [Leuconostoc kimchii]
MAKLKGIILLSSSVAALQIIDTRTDKKFENVHREFNESDINASVFTSEIMRRALEQIHRFQQLLRDYAVIDVQLFGSEALSQVKNAVYFADQIESTTGLKINWLNGNQESYYRQLAVRQSDKLQQNLSLKNTFVLGMSSNRIDLGYFEKNRFEFSQHSAIGPVRLAQSINEMSVEVAQVTELAEEFINSKLADFWHMLPPFKPTETLVLLGGTAAQNIFLSEQKHWENISKKQIKNVISDLSGMNDQAIIDKYAIDLNDVPFALTEMLLLMNVMTAIAVDEVKISDLTMLDGLSMKDIHDEDDIITAARGIADRYMVEEKHREVVLKYAQQLFDRLKKVHHLDKRDRLLLGVSALVHDVGSFINSQRHYQYSEEILSGIDFHGLSTVEQRMIASIARYHSAETPDSALRTVQDFSPQQRLRIAKLAALLRLADALDDSRLQKIDKLTVSVTDKSIKITGQSVTDLQLEIYTFDQKAVFFEAVFGLPISLKRKGRRV